MMKVAIVLASPLPVPAVKGGAIETLVTNLINQNEVHKELKLSIFSSFDHEALAASREYKYTHFVWIRYNILNKAVNLVTRSYSKITGISIPHFGILKTIQKLKRGDYDYIVVEGSISLLASISKKYDTSTIFFHLHSTTLFANPEVYNSCKKVIVVSDFLKNQVELRTQLRSDRIAVLRNCVDLTKFSCINKQGARLKVRGKYKIHDDEIVICFVGRIDEGKGLRELFRALSLIPKELRYSLLVIGSPGLFFGKSKIETPYYKEIIAMALNLKRNVVFTGFVHNDRIPEMLSASDILVVPSTGEEAQGLVVLEGFAAGLPVVTTDSGGIPENVNNDSAVVISRDEEMIYSLSWSIKELILSSEKRQEMGNAGMCHVKQYNCLNYYREFIDILNS